MSTIFNQIFWYCHCCCVSLYPLVLNHVEASRLSHQEEKEKKQIWIGRYYDCNLILN